MILYRWKRGGGGGGGGGGGERLTERRDERKRVGDAWSRDGAGDEERKTNMEWEKRRIEKVRILER